MGRLQNTNVIPLGVAVQALALFVAAFFITPSSDTANRAAGAGSNAADSAEALTSLSELPTDLRREMLPVPRVPERENRKEPPQPTPNDDGNDSLMSEGPKLASLRTQSVALSGPVASPISAPMLGVPDSLDGLSLAGGAWLGGGNKSRRGRGSQSGGGPSGIGGGGPSAIGGGGGGGSGGYCPTPGRIGGGGSRGGGSGSGSGVGAGTGRPRGGGKATGTSRGRPAGSGSGSAARGTGRK